MSALIETLANIFDSRFIQEDKTCIIEEKERMSRKLLWGKIQENDYLVCRLDPHDNSNTKDLFPYLRGNSSDHGFSGMKSICDYAIFVNKNLGNDLYTILIELKKGKDSPKAQLDMSEPFIEFIFSRARKLHLISETTKISYRKIGITDRNINDGTKRGTNIQYDSNRFAQLYLGQHIRMESLLH